MRSCLLPVVLAGAGLASLHAWGVQAPPTPQTTFRAGVDLVQVDVAVLDKDRRPVRGLAAADFTLLEDGQPRPIVAFTAVDLPERAAPGAAAWKSAVQAGVATNDIPEEGRLVVILMDRSIPAGWPTINAQAIAKLAVDELGAGDYAAVVYTGGGASQGFTNDRQTLLSAITGDYPTAEASGEANAVWEGLLANLDNPEALSAAALPALNYSAECLCGACVLDAIASIADAVREVGRRRKSLLFIGRDVQIETTESICIDPVRKARNAMFRSLDLASLTVHALDPSGLETLAPMANVTRLGRYGGRANVVRQSNIAVLPSRTGGRTVLNTNNPAMRVPEIFDESDSYYLLGFQPRAVDGQRHDISVKVNRRGVDVRTRRGYVASAAAVSASSRSDSAGPAGALSPLAAIGGLMPERNGVALSVQASAVAVPATREPTVAVTVHVRHERSAALAPALLPGPEQVDIATAVFSMAGRAIGALQQTVTVTPQAGAGGLATYDVLQRLPARPGRYELRIGLVNQARRQRGSVYTFVDVPDFSHAAFAMSDIAIFAPAGARGMSDRLEDVLPAPPTARREFSRGETATAFVRFYEGTEAPPASVFLTTRILDARDRKRYGQDTSIASTAFSRGAAADYAVDLPLADLEPGEYLLIIEAKTAGTTTTRELIFGVVK